MHHQHEVDLPHADITDRIIGAFYDVYRELGYGFSEVVYRRALAIALRQNGLEISEERMISVTFRGSNIGTFYADLVVAGVILVEVKASSTIEKYAEAQILNYLKAAGGGIGLLLNFGHSPTYKRFAMGDDPTNSLPGLRSRQL
ncbi:MAG TPA: GxxExxY protein [Vicinamibacterales bacterium]|nr:GxxExxY protein [Vicinamibacterales bacterium]